MKNKYYTPDISEFHIGFEYEARDARNTGFEKKVVTKDTRFNSWSYEELSFSEMVARGWIMVKYLDKEDIEGLGWELHETTLNCWVSLNKEFYLYFFENNYIMIDDGEDIESFTSFRGYIKNKGELKKVMDMLRITDKKS